MKLVSAFRSKRSPSSFAAFVRLSGDLTWYPFVIRRGDFLELQRWLFERTPLSVSREKGSKRSRRPRAKKEAHAA